MGVTRASLANRFSTSAVARAERRVPAMPAARSATVPIGDATSRANLLLLIQLRWVAIGGQILAITLARLVLAIPLPLPPMAAVILCLVALNLVDTARYRSGRSVSNHALFFELLLDVGALTVQLYLSGGDTNPFISLFLLQVILGAVLLENWSSWAIVALTSACYLWLTVAFHPITFPHQMGGEFFDLHVHGMFICFLLAAVVLVVCVGRINRNLRARDIALEGLRRQSLEEDHIVRMGLLASGAAHELGTPLATMSVLLNDWQRTPALANDAELSRDMTELQAQLTRCKSILSAVLLSAGEVRGEGTLHTTLNTLLDEAADEWRASRSPQVLDYRNEFAPDEVIVADAALKSIIFNLFDNALEASPGWVGIVANRRAGQVVVRVHDRGPGFSEPMLADLGRPYRSSKDSAGRGLGLFLVCNVVRKLGGSVTASNRPEGGACLELALPLAALCHGR